MVAATTKAPMPSEWVRAQSPTSSHNRHDRPRAIQARLAATPVPEARRKSRSPWFSATPARARSVSDSEYVDIDALREFGGVGGLLEHRDHLEIVGIGFQLALEDLADGMMMMGVVAHHALDIGKRRRLRRIGLERFCRLLRVLRGKHRSVQQRL